jgi:hypothetical protein
VDMLEEVRLAALAEAGGPLTSLYGRLVTLVEGEGLRIDGQAEDIVDFNPARHRVVAGTSNLEPGVPVAIVRPAYVLSEADATTVLRPGDVRPAG